MSMRMVVGTLALVACSSEAPPAAKEAPAAKPAPTAPNADGVPASIQLVPGYTLVTRKDTQSGGIWTYSYTSSDPLALAEQQQRSLDSSGWKTVLRKTSIASQPGPSYAVYGNLGDKLVVAEIAKSGPLTLKLFLEPMAGLRLEPPAGYPAGFPFLAFGIHHEAGSTPTRMAFVYNGELAGLVTELGAAAKAAGWDCGSAAFTQLTGCRKDGTELLVQLSSLSSNRQTLFIGKP